jgi:hypothetical protein
VDAVPDLDIIDRKALTGWRPALRMLVGNAAPTEVAQAALRSCVKSIRDHGGIPAYPDFEDVLRCRSSLELDSESALTRIDAIADQGGHTRHAKLAAEAARRLVIDRGHNRRVIGSLRVAFCEEFLRTLADNALFERVGPDLGKHYKGPQDARLRRAECKEALAPALRELASKLAAEPEGEGVRVPRGRLSPRRTTAEILAQPIM